MKINKKIEIRKKRNKYLVVIYFLGSLSWLNNIGYSLYSHAIGIALMIAAIYGVICVTKNQKFLF